MRPIDADALMQATCDGGICSDCEDAYKGPNIFANCSEIRLVFLRIINDAPTIDADRPQGKWIDEADKYEASFGMHDYKCSNCNHYADDHIGGHEWYTMYKPNYCPYCGARMKGADDE